MGKTLLTPHEIPYRLWGADAGWGGGKCVGGTGGGERVGPEIGMQ